MASIRRRNGLWQVQVRGRHAGSTSKSFHRKTDAERFAIFICCTYVMQSLDERAPFFVANGKMLVAVGHTAPRVLDFL